MREKLGKVDPYFGKLADAMVTWIHAWHQLNPPAEQALANGDASKLPNGAKA